MSNDLNLTLEQKWEQAGLSNNFIFYKVLRHNPHICQKILELLLHIEIDHIEMSQEDEIIIDFNSKYIRLDLYVKDSNRVFDIEIQVKDTKELPERSRYYQSVMDVDFLKSGQEYSELKESHVIFICMEDIFNKNMPVYTFQNLCLEDKSIALNDRTFKHFFVVPNCAKMLKEETEKAFFNFIMTNKSSDSFTDELLDSVKKAKTKAKWRKQYMEWERYMTYSFRDGKEEGLAEGISQGRELQRQEDEKIIAKLTAEKDSRISMQQAEVARQQAELQRLMEENARLKQLLG